MNRHILLTLLIVGFGSSTLSADEQKLISQDLLSEAFKKTPMVCFQNASNKWHRVSKVDSDFPNQYGTSTSCKPFTDYMKDNYSGWDNKRYYPTGGGFFYQAKEWDVGNSPELIQVLQSQQKEASSDGQAGEGWQCKIAWLNTSKVGLDRPPEDFQCTVQCCAFDEDVGVRK